MYDTTTGSSAVRPAAARDSDDALYRKVSRRIIPFLFLCYVVSFLDRIARIISMPCASCWACSRPASSPASSSTSPASGHGSVPCGRQSWVRLSNRAGDLSVGRQ